MIKKLIFDLDNTLIIWKDEYSLELKYLLEEYKVDTDYKKVDKIIDDLEYKHDTISKEILLNEIEQEGIDIIKIIEENNLSGDFPLGKRVKRVRGAYNGTDASPITETEKEEAEKLGILGKKRGNKTKIKSVINQNRENLSSALESGVELETEILMAEKITERSASDGRGQ